MPKFNVERIEIKKSELKRIAGEQLNFFIFAGYILNEFIFVQKLLMACQNRGSRLLSQKRKDARWRIQLHGNTTQMFICQRMALAKVYEAKIFLEQYAFKKVWFKELRKKLSPAAKTALKKLQDAITRDKKQGEKSPFYVGRNKFFSHYYIPPVINATAKDDNIPDIFYFFFPDHLGSSLHFSNEEVLTKIFYSMIELKSKNIKVGIGRTYDLILKRMRLIQNFLAECISTIIYPEEEENRLKLKNKTVILNEKYDIHNFEIPWFIPKGKNDSLR